MNREAAIPVEKAVEQDAPQRRFRLYPEYRDSGVEWLGKTPTHWKVRKLKHIASLRTSNVDKKSHEQEQPVRLCNYTDVYYNEQITADLAFMEATASLEEIEKFSLMKGDVIITKDSEDPNDIAVPACVVDDLEGVLCGYHLAQIRSNPSLAHGPYLARAFKASGIRDQFSSQATGITRHGLSKDTIGSSLFFIPPPDEQQAIAAFLDRETRRIDELVAKKQRLIELLAEKRTALISHAVTKGLNPDAPMKDTGVEWLGKIPKHWKAVQLRRVLHTIEQGWSPQAEQRQADEGEWAVLKVGAVYKGHFRPSEQKALPADVEPEERFEVVKGDLLLTRGNTPKLVADACVVPDTAPRLMMSDLHYRVSVDGRRMSQYFLCYWLLSSVGRLQIECDARGTSESMVKVSQSHIRSWITTVPPLSDQERIVALLDSDAERSIALVSRVQEAIDRLREYRSALISATVTGKINIQKEV